MSSVCKNTLECRCISFHTDIFGILNSSKGLFIAFLHGKNRNECRSYIKAIYNCTILQDLKG
jgi:hypothetical protein